jgi:hypothetical protein
LLLPPLPLPVSSPANLTHDPCRRHHHPLRRHRHRSPSTIVAIATALAAVAIASVLPATLIAITIALATLTLALFVARQPRHVAITHVVAVNAAIALVTVNRLPPS